MMKREQMSAIRRLPGASLLRACFIAVLAAHFSFLQLSPNLAWAGSITDAQKIEIAKAVAAFEVAFKNADYKAVVQLSIPPKLRAAIATRLGVTQGNINQAVIEYMAKLMAAIQFEKFGMATGGTQYLQDANGQPFGLIPTSVVVVVGNHRAASEGHTLALYEESKWWLLRVEEKQLPLLLEAYPEFSRIDFPKEKMEIKINER